MKAYAGECDRLGELLGNDTTSPRSPMSSCARRPLRRRVDLERLLELIAARREELQAEARRLGAYLAAARDPPAWVTAHRVAKRVVPSGERAGRYGPA